MKIYWIKAQAPLRVLALAKYLNLEFEPIHLDLMNGGLRSPEYAKLNPNKKAPALLDGKVELWESLAIMVYLADKAGSSMWPSQNVKEQIEILKWVGWDSHHWEPAVAHFYFEHIVKPTLLNAQPDPKELEGKSDDLIRWAQVLNEHLDGKEFVACDRLTIVDFYLASMARYWKEAEMPLSKFANITGWLDRLMQIPAWREPWPINL
jgi:glutathione S-transferase